MLYAVEGKQSVNTKMFALHFRTLLFFFVIALVLLRNYVVVICISYFMRFLSAHSDFTSPPLCSAIVQCKSP